MTYSGAGTHFINQSDTTTLTAKVYEDGADVTDAIHESAFIWTRESGDVESDEVWNQAHIGIKQITVTPTDISERAIIACSLLSAADMTLSFRLPIARHSIQFTFVNDIALREAVAALP